MRIIHYCQCSHIAPIAAVGTSAAYSAIAGSFCTVVSMWSPNRSCVSHIRVRIAYGTLANRNPPCLHAASATDASMRIAIPCHVHHPVAARVPTPNHTATVADCVHRASSAWCGCQHRGCLPRPRVAARSPLWRNRIFPPVRNPIAATVRNHRHCYHFWRYYNFQRRFRSRQHYLLVVSAAR